MCGEGAVIRLCYQVCRTANSMPSPVQLATGVQWQPLKPTHHPNRDQHRRHHRHISLDLTHDVPETSAAQRRWRLSVT
jgi:hypothetical protein